MRKAVTIMVEQVSFWLDGASFGYMAWSSIAGSYGKWIFSFLRGF